MFESVSFVNNCKHRHTTPTQKEAQWQHFLLDKDSLDCHPHNKGDGIKQDYNARIICSNACINMISLGLYIIEVCI